MGFAALPPNEATRIGDLPMQILVQD